MDKQSQSVVKNNKKNQHRLNSIHQNLNKNKVQNEIATLISENKIPSALQDFLDNIWQKVMLNISEKHTTDSQQWKSAIEFVKLFVWYLEPVQSPEEQEEKTELLPALKKIIEFNCQLLHYPDIKKQAVLDLVQP